MRVPFITHLLGDTPHVDYTTVPVGPDVETVGSKVETVGSIVGENVGVSNVEDVASSVGGSVGGKVGGNVGGIVATAKMVGSIVGENVGIPSSSTPIESMAVGSIVSNIVGADGD